MKEAIQKKKQRQWWILLLLIPLLVWRYSKPTSVWRDCGERLQCHDLLVPLNYSDPQSKRIKIAVNRYKAKKPTKQTILVNPGGPGASGIDMVNSQGASLSKMLGDEVDIVGFDPRGVQDSIPLRCLPTLAHEQLFQSQFSLMGNPFRSIQLSQDEFTDLEALTDLLGQSCLKQSGEHLPFVSTANVARDMESIRLFLKMDKMHYWGFSYGTFLGATYANLFPDNVGNMIIDGVVNPTKFSGDIFDLQFDSLVDHDKMIQAFFNACDQSESCAFRSENKSSVKFQELVERTKRKPLKLFDLAVPAILTGDLIEQSVFVAMYGPAKWPAYAEALQQAYEGNATLLYNRVGTNKQPKDTCSTDSKDTPYSGLGTFCADTADSTSQKSLKDIQKIMSEQKQVNQVALESIMAGLSRCAGFPRFKEQERYAGPWNKTFANPVLVIGNTLDPVTPYQAAFDTTKIMNQGHDRNAVFLHHNGHGHCSNAQPSKCTIEIIRNYLVDGVLPKEGTVCEPDVPLFGQQKMDVELAAAQSLADIIHHMNTPHYYGFQNK
ncbi:alpha/beta hydrolase fold-domain-containing protein [Gorgonomyces haynaldii]|nr:alpha/beta hydrolase fold-domain-containing protein [Gorgonomyces haynaldii]